MGDHTSTYTIGCNRHTDILYCFSTMVRAQMLSELEEIILYKQHADQPERRQTMRKTWMKRYYPPHAILLYDTDLISQASRLPA